MRPPMNNEHQAMTFVEAVAQGLVKGAAALSKYGERNIPSGVAADIHSGTALDYDGYIPPGSGDSLYIAAGDLADAGRKYRVWYIEDGTFSSEFVDMVHGGDVNSPVYAVNAIRVHRAREMGSAVVLYADSANNCPRDVAFMSVATAKEMCHIPAGSGTTQMCIFSTPKGVSLNGFEFHFSVNSGKILDKITVMMRENYDNIAEPSPWVERHTKRGIAGGTVGAVRYHVPLVVPELTDVRVRVTFGVGSDGFVTADINGALRTTDLSGLNQVPAI